MLPTNLENLENFETGARTGLTYLAALDDFVIREASSRADLNACFQLRHQVYCVEHEFEPLRIDGRAIETDIYDDNSVHALVEHKPTGLISGTVRLVLPDTSLNKGLPILDFVRHDEMTVPIPFTAEISRFAVSKEFRRVIAQQRKSGHTAPNRIDSDIATIALIRAFFELASVHGIHYFCALMERRLIRRIARLGIHFRPVGPEVDCHGQRTPCVVGALEMLDGVLRERPDVWRALSDNGRMLNEFCHPMAAE